MPVSSLIELLAIPVLVIIVLIVIGMIMSRFYRRATREISLVKTGAGGKRVIMDGGTISLPMFHEITRVNMKTLRLEVRRSSEGALITRDRMRVDVGAEFYVSVNATNDGVSRAAQTLGDRTFDVNSLREMIEGKLVDALRSVAARMSMDELHENRSDFVQEVKNTVSEDLMKNGLELESVSLTALDQTPFDALDENNAFNAVGMKKLAEVIATSKKERAKIDADAEVSVRQSLLEAERRKIEIAKEEEEAKIEQVQMIATARAEQQSAIALKEEESQRISESARIDKEKRIRAAEIARERELSEAEIIKDQEIEVAEQMRQIAVAKKSEEESKARGLADAARAEAIKALEQIETNRQVAEAEREKSIALIEAEREAQRQATRVRVQAAAEKDAANDLAAARREEAQADADAITIRAEAKKQDKLAEAEGNRALIESENSLGSEIIKMRIELAKVEMLPVVIEQMVKPTEKIESIRINHISGLSSNPSGTGGGGNKEQAVVSQAVDSVMGMALQMPTLKKLGDELGMSFDNGIEGLVNGPQSASGKDESGNKEPDEDGQSS
ncbi:flotillin domain-containing protein [Gammaproteobacteria bacterium]|nr:flotillin domain-containing protein [Gammaproteobacteria bacterium]